jgi:cell division control protein 45
MFIGRKDYRVAYNTIVNAARQAISLSRGTSAVTVLILCAPDVDALCACRILVSLLNDDCVGYRVLPISGWAELATCAQDHIQDNADLRSVLLLNLGALVDLVEYIPLPEAVSLHVIDSHRPWNLANVFSAGLDAQRVIVWDDGDVAEVLQEERTAFEALQVGPFCDASCVQQAC